ncbi:MAG: pilus assembly protein [Pseudomonadota bacterium]
MKTFLQNESGAVTIDWVSLTAGILVLGIMLVWGIFNAGVAPLVGTVNGELEAVTIDIPLNPTPNLNP